MIKGEPVIPFYGKKVDKGEKTAVRGWAVADRIDIRWISGSTEVFPRDGILDNYVEFLRRKEVYPQSFDRTTAGRQQTKRFFYWG